MTQLIGTVYRAVIEKIRRDKLITQREKKQDIKNFKKHFNRTWKRYMEGMQVQGCLQN